EHPVAKPYQGLMLAAIVPSEQRTRQRSRCPVEEAVGVEVVHEQGGIVFAQPAAALPGKERGWRQLHLVTDNDHLPGAVKRGNGVLDRNLAGLVENDDVEELLLQRQNIGNAQRTHQPDRLQAAQHATGLACEQLADRLVGTRFLELIFQRLASAPEIAAPVLLLLCRASRRLVGARQIAIELLLADIHRMLAVEAAQIGAAL